MTEIIVEGTEIFTVGRFGQKCASFHSGGTKFSIPIWSGKTYVAKRNRHGDLKWFFKECWGRTVASHRLSAPLVGEVKAIAKANNVNFDGRIVHLRKCYSKADNQPHSI